MTRTISNNIPVNYKLFWYNELNEIYPEYRLFAVKAVALRTHSEIKESGILCSSVPQQKLCVDETGIRSSLNFNTFELPIFTFVITGVKRNVLDGTTSSLESYVSFEFEEGCSIVNHLLNETLRRCQLIFRQMQRINNSNKIQFNVPKSHGKIVIEDITIINGDVEHFFWTLTHAGRVLSNKQCVTSEILRLVIDVTNINVFDVVVRHSTSLKSYTNDVTVKIRYYILGDFCRQSFCYANSLHLQLASNNCVVNMQATLIHDRLKMCTGK